MGKDPRNCPCLSFPEQRASSARSSFFDANAEGLHLAIQMAALQPQSLGSAADVAVELVQLLQNVIPLIRLTRLQQRRKLFAAWIDWRRQLEQIAEKQQAEEK
jgi:hypothetical protein